MGGTNTSMVNQGSSGSLRSDSFSPNPPCCGSSAVHEDSVFSPSGIFSRSESGGVMVVGSTKGLGSNIYPPGKINDLSLGNLDFIEGTVTSNHLYFSSNQTLIHGDTFDESEVELVGAEYIAGNTTFAPLPASEGVNMPLNMGMFNVSEQYYFRVKATDRGGKFSLSNVARLFITEVSNSAATQGINFGIFLLMLVASQYYC